MHLLAIDTSGKNGSIALANVSPGHASVEIIEVVPLDGGAFSAQMVPQIAKLLKKHGGSMSSLAGFAVVSGPGSFTGLRVGLAAVKALAEVSKKPIAAISLLEAIGRSGASRGHVLAIQEAGRGEIYVGHYEIGALDPNVAENSIDLNRVHLHSERLVNREKFLDEAGSEDSKSQIVTPDHALAAALQSAGIKVELIGYPDTGVIARLGWERLERGQTVLPEKLQANYIGHSDSEIFSKPR